MERNDVAYTQRDIASVPPQPHTYPTGVCLKCILLENSGWHPIFLLSPLPSSQICSRGSSGSLEQIWDVCKDLGKVWTTCAQILWVTIRCPMCLSSQQWHDDEAAFTPPTSVYKMAAKNIPKKEVLKYYWIILFGHPDAVKRTQHWLLLRIFALWMVCVSNESVNIKCYLYIPYHFSKRSSIWCHNELWM